MEINPELLKEIKSEYWVLSPKGWRGPFSSKGEAATVLEEDIEVFFGKQWAKKRIKIVRRVLAEYGWALLEFETEDGTVWYALCGPNAQIKEDTDGEALTTAFYQAVEEEKKKLRESVQPSDPDTSKKDGFSPW